MRSMKSVSAAVVVALVAMMTTVNASDKPARDGSTAAPKARSTPATTGQISALKGVKAAPMSSKELGAVKGMHVHFLDGNGGFHLAGNPENSGVGIGNWYDNGNPGDALVAPRSHGLCVAVGVGPIVIPTGGGPSQCP